MTNPLRQAIRHIDGSNRVAAWKEAVGEGQADPSITSKLTAELALPKVNHLGFVSLYGHRILRKGGDPRKILQKTIEISTALSEGLGQRSADGGPHFIGLQAIDLRMTHSSPHQNESFELAGRLGTTKSTVATILPVWHPEPTDRFPRHSSLERVSPRQRAELEEELREEYRRQGLTLGMMLNGHDTFATAYPRETNLSYVAISSAMNAEILGITDPHSKVGGSAFVLTGADPEAGTVEWEQVA